MTRSPLSFPLPAVPSRLALAALLACAVLPLAPAARAQTAAEPSLPYTVRPHDKLIVMTRELLNRPSDWGTVAKFNGLKDPNFIKPGQVLNIPLRLMKSQPAAGRVVSTSGDVRLSGTPATVGAPVTEGARVQTGPNSSAVVELGDGSRVQVLPNSLAEIVANRNYAMRNAGDSASTTWFSGLIRLAQGALDTLATKTSHRATPLQVETPTSLVGVRGTQFRVAFEDPATKNSRAEVVEGLVRADNPAQQSGADLPKGTGAVVNPAEREVKVVALLPAPDLAALPSELAKPQAALPMPTLAGASAYRVQVADSDSFERIVRDIKVAQRSVELGSLDTGRWFARVRGIDAQGLEGFDAIKLINIMQPAPPPATLRVVYASVSFENGQTVLTWSGVMSDGGALAQATPLREALGNIQPGRHVLRLKTTTAQGRAVETEYTLELPLNWGVTVYDLILPVQPAR